jgi:predicted porin
MTRTLAALAAAVIATGARAQTPPPAQPPPSDTPPAAAAPAAPAAPAVAAPAEPKKAEKKLTYAIGPRSQISVAGRAWTELNNVRADKGTGTKAVQNLTRLSSNSSYLRVSGEREFDKGWKLITQIEAEVGFDGEAGTPFSSTRDTYVGVDSPFGQLIFGKFDSPAKETTIGRDPFGGTGIFGYYNVFTAYRADRRMNNAMMYESPTYEGFKLLAAFSLGEAKFAKTTVTDYQFSAFDPTSGTTSVKKITKAGTGPRVDPYLASAAIHYRNKVAGNPLYVGVAYEYRNDCSNPDTENAGGPSCDRAALGTDKAPNGVDQVIRVGADYTITSTFTKIAAVYDHTSLERPEKYGVAKASLSRDAYWGSITQGILSNKHQLILNYGMATKYSGTPNAGASYDKTGVQTYTVSYRLNLDANAMVYAAFTQILNDDGQTQKFGSGSPPGTEGNGWKGAPPTGSTVTGFGVGMRYMF